MWHSRFEIQRSGVFGKVVWLHWVETLLSSGYLCGVGVTVNTGCPTFSHYASLVLAGRQIIIILDKKQKNIETPLLLHRVFVRDQR